MKRLIHDQDGVYMIDEDCLKKKERQEREKEMRWQNKGRLPQERKRKPSTSKKRMDRG